ncbi:MAG: hypothetical protein ACYC6G_09220 [Desulfobaccales bacterium]
MASANRHPALVALLCTDKTIYLSGPASVWGLDHKGGAPECLATVPLPWHYRQAARWRHLRRLGRLDVRELLQVPGGGLLGISQKQIISIDPGSGEILPVFKVTNGGRPKGFALTPSGHLFVGEYWGNPQRRALRIWASIDHGASWEVAYSLPAGSAKHIHNIVWDQHRQGLWVLTGDSDGECALLFSQDEFQTVTELVRGGQLYRACHLFCLPEGLYYGTDTERDQNWIVHLDVKSGFFHKIHPLSGSCIHAAYMAGQYFISSAVEPSTINTSRKTVLWSSSDLHTWSNLVEFQKDWWPGEYFGFGRIILPRVQGKCPHVVFSTIAVKGHDLNTFIIR